MLYTATPWLYKAHFNGGGPAGLLRGGCSSADEGGYAPPSPAPTGGPLVGEAACGGGAGGNVKGGRKIMGLLATKW